MNRQKVNPISDKEFFNETCSTRLLLLYAFRSNLLLTQHQKNNILTELIVRQITRASVENGLPACLKFVNVKECAFR